MLKNKPRGFATLTPERRREISRMGAQALAAKGLAHRFTKAEAREAAKKGGAAYARKMILKRSQAVLSGEFRKEENEKQSNHEARTGKTGEDRNGSEHGKEVAAQGEGEVTKR